MKIRSKDQGLIYLRRSSNRQELSLAGQLEWALKAAREQGVHVAADISDLDHMQRMKLHSYKDIRLDDAISGADLSRPGFLAVQVDLMANTRKSHLFIHMRDRFGRPSDAYEMAMREKSIRFEGVTIVLSTEVAVPLDRGEGNLGEDLKLLVEYYLSGDFLRRLAERVITAQLQLATRGYRTGGNAPYGFVRVLVDSQGNVIEELRPRRRVREPGCHVQIRPKDPEKIAIWLFILELAKSGWGAKRITNKLNEMGVPSPDAGKVRHDHGVAHRISGKWNSRTVLELLRNPAIIAVQQYGRRSEGAHRRLGVGGHRPLDDSDRTETKAKLVYNDDDLVIRKPANYDPQVDAEEWHALQQELDERGKSQRGIPRVKDLTKYPLSCRVIDMTGDCGSFMYCRTSGKRPLYVCGRYMKEGPTACDNNAVDANALLRFVLETIQAYIGDANTMARLRELVDERLKSNQTSGKAAVNELESTSLKSRYDALQSELSDIEYNYARERDDSLRQVIRNQLQGVKAELSELESRLQALQPKALTVSSPEAEVDAAMSILTDFQQIAANPKARAELTELFRRLGLQIGLTFKAGKKGKRAVRVLSSGILAFGGAALPTKLFGRDRVVPSECNHVESNECTNVQSPERAPSEPGTATEGSIATKTPDDSTNAPSPGNVEPSMRPNEGISCTKVSRGDRI